MKQIAVESFPLEDIGMPTIWWEGVPLFNIEDSFLLMDYCTKNGIGVLGVEGFYLKGGRRIPNMDCIVDFSGLIIVDPLQFKTKSVDMMTAFLNCLAVKDIFLEFVLVKL